MYIRSPKTGRFTCHVVGREIVDSGNLMFSFERTSEQIALEQTIHSLRELERLHSRIREAPAKGWAPEEIAQANVARSEQNAALSKQLLLNRRDQLNVGEVNPEVVFRVELTVAHTEAEVAASLAALSDVRLDMSELIDSIPLMTDYLDHCRRLIEEYISKLDVVAPVTGKYRFLN